MDYHTEIDIIIPTYNGSRHIHGILNSINNQSFQNHTCIVIDDNSNDSTTEIIRNNFPWVQLIAQNTNQGPSKNRNTAIRSGKSPYIVIFDDDTYLKDLKWLETAADIMRNNPAIGQIASMILSGDDNDTLLDCGITLNGYLFGGIYYKEKVKNMLGRHMTSMRILGACTAGTVIRRDVFENVCGFDAEYYYSIEDVDLSMRIHLAGYDVIYEPALKTYHFESQAMGKNVSRKMYFYRRNCLLAIAENLPAFFIFKKLTFVIVKELILRTILYILKSNKIKNRNETLRQIKDFFKANCYLLSRVPKIRKKRKKIDHVRTRSRMYLVDTYKSLNNRISSGVS